MTIYNMSHNKNSNSHRIALDSSVTHNNNSSANLVTDTKTDMMFNAFADGSKLNPVLKNPLDHIDEKSISSVTSSYSRHSHRSKKSDKNYYDTTPNVHSGIKLSEMDKDKDSMGNVFINNAVKGDTVKEPKLTASELKLQKLNMLRKLGELAQKGIKLSQNYNMNSDLDAMMYEYELHVSIKSKQNSINWMSNIMMNCIYGIEMMNDKYDPFSLKLTGWSESINRDINSYYDIFGELYEKYSGPGKNIAPELKLVFALSASAIKFHLTNTVINGLPSINEEFKNNPAMAQKLREKALADKVKQMNTTEKQQLENYINKQRENAYKKANDMRMLEKAKKEMEIKQQLLHAENELNRLQEQNSRFGSIGDDNKQTNDQFNNEPHVSDHIMKSVIKPPGMLEHMQNKISTTDMVDNKQQVTNQVLEEYRKQEIMKQHQELMKQKEELASKTKTHNSTLGDLMSNTSEHVSSATTIDADNVSSNSRVILRRSNKRKPRSIKVNTEN